MAAKDDDSEFQELGSSGEESTLEPDEIEPGETVTGSIRNLILYVGQYDKAVAVLVEDDEVTCYRITAGCAYDILDADVSPGTVVKFERSDEEDTFPTDDGEQTYYPLSVSAKGGDD